MDKDQWLIISGVQIRRDEAQRIPTLFRLFSMVGIRWEQIFYIISQVQFLPSSTILSPIRPTNNSKSVAFHTTVPMWSFNWSWYFNERSISVLRANYERKTFHCLAYFCNSLGTIATFMWIREETLFTMTMSQSPSSLNRNFVWKCQNDLPKYLNDFIYFS